MLFSPVVLQNKEPVPIATLLNPVDVALKAVVEPIEIFLATFPFPRPISNPLIEPVTTNDPVICAEPVNGNAPPPPTTAKATDAVPNKEPVNPADVNCPKIQARVVLELPITVVFEPDPIAQCPIMISLVSPLANGLIQ